MEASLAPATPPLPLRVVFEGQSSRLTTLLHTTMAILVRPPSSHITCVHLFSVFCQNSRLEIIFSPGCRHNRWLGADAVVLCGVLDYRCLCRGIGGWLPVAQPPSLDKRRLASADVSFDCRIDDDRSANGGHTEFYSGACTWRRGEPRAIFDRIHVSNCALRRKKWPLCRLRCSFRSLQSQVQSCLMLCTCKSSDAASAAAAVAKRRLLEF